MSKNMPDVQKATFLKLARKYDPDVYKIVSRGDPETIRIDTEAELAEIELFSSKIVSLVGNDYPDAEGQDQDINDDAVMVAFLCSRVMTDYEKRTGRNRNKSLL